MKILAIKFDEYNNINIIEISVVAVLLIKGSYLTFF